MLPAALQPSHKQALVDPRSGTVTRPWADYFLELATRQISEDQRALYEALAARVSELEDADALSFTIYGQQSIIINGSTQPGGALVITLEGDADAPGNTRYYGTGPDGQKGWYAVSDAILVTANELTKAVGTDGVTTLGLADVADSGTGTLQKTQFDAKGRKTGTASATTTDLPEGSNLYFTNARADGRINAQKGQPNGIAPLGPDSLVPAAFLPPYPSPGIPEAPTDGQPYARQSSGWQALDGPLSPYYLLKFPALTDQLGNVLTDQQGRVLLGNTPAIPYQWLSSVPANLTGVAGLTGQGYAFRSTGGGWSLQSIGDIHTLVAMTLAEANALTPVALGRMVIITDLTTGNPEPCWYDATLPSGTKWRRFSDRSIAT